MSALEWLEATEASEATQADSGYEGTPAAPVRAQASQRTIYKIYLNHDDTYLCVVTISASSGPMTTTYQLKPADSEQAAKEVAQADWDSGKRP
jgi:hypothetical protein